MRRNAVALSGALVSVLLSLAAVPARNAISQPAVPRATKPTTPTTPKEAPCVPGDESTENGIPYIHLCAGTFTMGSAANDPRAFPQEKPAHPVSLSELWIGKTEITNEQYRRFRPDHMGEANLPATKVSWTEAKAACEHFGGRLPTEAEWEYAARAGSQTAWSFGDDAKKLDEYAWYDNNSGRTPHPVGTKKPNLWHLHDMHGNVWEWVNDWSGRYPSTAQVDPAGPEKGEYRVLRGGAFYYPSGDLRSADREQEVPERGSMDVGFRCARGARRQP
ncbi:MAG TPA: formylglycine-generating enzyme family protein [Thermoanaerobaculia bacterium]|nr:formylglycine-generating enzyme family protein [Thermoanaerobaculia bacterium]